MLKSISQTTNTNDTQKLTDEYYLPNKDDLLSVLLHYNFDLNEVFRIWSSLVANYINLRRVWAYLEENWKLVM